MFFYIRSLGKVVSKVKTITNNAISDAYCVATAGTMLGMFTVLPLFIVLELFSRF